MLQLDEFKLDSPEFARLSGLAPGSFYRRPEAYSQSGLKVALRSFGTKKSHSVANVTRMLDVDHTGRSVFTDDRQRDW